MINIDDETFLSPGNKLYGFTCSYCKIIITSHLRIACVDCPLQTGTGTTATGTGSGSGTGAGAGTGIGSGIGKGSTGSGTLNGTGTGIGTGTGSGSNSLVPFSLCSDCFCSGVELGSHKPWHRYRIGDCIHYPIFHKDWTVYEELLLLDGIEKYGLGNWKMISEYIGTKTLKQCENHYWDDYLGKFGSCLPSQCISIDRTQFLPISHFLYPNSPEEKTLVHLPSEDLIDLPISTCFPVPEENSLPERAQSLTNNQPKLRESLSTTSGANSARKEQEIREKLASLPGAEIAGYMPLREDFDTEHNNDAEQILVDMEFNADDHPAERMMKLKVIELYNQKLTERDERKKFVLQRGLIDIKKQQQSEKKRSKDERDLLARLKVFSRFLAPEEYEALVDGIVDMRKLKKQIECYRLYRSLGIRTIDQARKYETDRKRREYQLKAQKSRQSSNYLPPTYGTDASSLSLSSSLAENSTTGTMNTRRAHSLSSVSLSSMDGQTPVVPHLINPAEVPEEFRSIPGANFLSEREIQLCYHTQLFPYHYIAIQEALVREMYRNGSLTKEGFHRVVRSEGNDLAQFTRGSKRAFSSMQADSSQISPNGLDQSTSDCLFDFFVENCTKANPAQLQAQQNLPKDMRKVKLK